MQNNPLKNYIFAFVLVQAFFVLQIYPSLLLAETKVGGPIDKDTVWTPSGSPYIVTMHTEVTQGSTLRIKPGVVVKFQGPYFLKISGMLIARGTKSSPIAFTSDKKEPGAWIGILFEKTAKSCKFDKIGNYIGGSILEYCKVEHGGARYLFNYFSNGAIRCSAAAPFIRNSILSENFVGVTARSSRSLNIQHCKLVKNKGSAISISRCSATIENSVIKSNFGSSAVNVLICDTKFENIIKINRNIIASNKGTGIRLKGGSCGYHNKENHVISSNIIKDNSGDGIYVSGQLRQVTIISNEITKMGPE